MLPSRSELLEGERVEGTPGIKKILKLYFKGSELVNLFSRLNCPTWPQSRSRIKLGFELLFLLKLIDVKIVPLNSYMTFYITPNNHILRAYCKTPTIMLEPVQRLLPDTLKRITKLWKKQGRDNMSPTPTPAPFTN